MAQFAGVSRRIRVEETVPRSALNRGIVFTLTDADGEIIPTAKIAAVQFNSGTLAGTGRAGQHTGFDGNTLLHNAVPALGAATAGEGTRQLAGARFGEDLRVMFSPDGHSVEVRGLRPLDEDLRRMWLEATFLLSTDVNSDDPVYITVQQLGAGIGAFDMEFVYPSATMHIADVNMPFTIETEATNIPHRAQSVPVENIVITENWAGAFVRDREIALGVSEFGMLTTRTDMGFNPIAQGDLAATGNLDFRLLPVALGAPNVRATVIGQSTGTNPGVLTLSNLDLFVNQAVPIGTYGVVVRGNAILDNDALVMNTGNSGQFLNIDNNPNKPGFRRYGFGGLVFSPYANITMPGAGDIGVGAAVDPSVARVTATQGSAVVEIDGRVVTMTNVHGQATPMFHYAGTNFFPMRGIAQVYGSEHAVAWTFVQNGERVLDWAPGVEVEVTISLGSRVIVFTTGSTTFTVNGIPNTMPAGQTPRNVGGTVFIPFAALGHALGVPVSWEGYGATQQFFFNQPERGTVVTLNGADAVAPVEVEEVEEVVEELNDVNEYYENNNGEAA
jgi:hypothetical protein